MTTTARNLLAVLTLALAGCISIPLPPPDPAPEPPEPPYWTIVVHTIPGARVWAYQDDPSRIAAQWPSATTEGRAMLGLVQGGYSVCAERAGYISRCEGVDVVREGIEVVLGLEPEPEPEPEPTPTPMPEPLPVPPPPVPDACGPAPAPTVSRLDCARQVAALSPHWQVCRDGSGLACHLFVRDVARALAAGDPAWGLITKNPGEQQCTLTWCGRGDGTGYGEDVVAYLPKSAPRDQWVGYDIVGGAGAPGASVQWGGPLPRRAGNLWAPVP